jgi:hydroxymethylpyrimidine/phosphomethylpyrimidine kinase
MTVRSTPNLKETEKLPLMANKTKTMKKTKMKKETKAKLIMKTKVVLVKAQMMSTPRSAHPLSEAQLRNPDIAIPAASASSRRVSGLIPPHVLHTTTSTTGIS